MWDESLDSSCAGVLVTYRGVQVRIRMCLPANQFEQVNSGPSKGLVVPGM